MKDSDVVMPVAHDSKDAADWRPFNVWAEQVRAPQSNPTAVAETRSESPRETWDPFSVWKRQVRGA